MSIVQRRVPVRPATVLIADDHTLVREGMKMIVASILEAVRFVEAHDADSLARAVRMNPDVRIALLDLNMPGMHGGLRLLELVRQCPALRLIVISSLNAIDIQHRVMDLRNVHAFVPKSSDVRTIHMAVEAAMQGRRLPPPTANRGAAPAASTLTPRQHEICALLRQGMSNKMIAATLGISTSTVKNHITEIFKALNATNRMQVARRAP